MDDQINEEERPTIELRTNLGALQGKFLIGLQHLVDIVAVSFKGVDRVDEQEYESVNTLLQVYPAQHQRLTKDSAVKESKRWYLRTASRDAIEMTHLFLEECWLICSLFALGAKGQFTADEYNQLITTERKKFHYLGLKANLELLKNKFEVVSDFQPHVLSMNAVRNCLVHRLGNVTDMDLDENGELKVLWRVVELYGESPDGKTKIIIHTAGTRIEGGWTVKMKFITKEKVFRKGDMIELTHDEITHTLFSLMSFAMSLVQSIELYGRKIGIAFPASSKPEA